MVLSISLWPLVGPMVGFLIVAALIILYTYRTKD